MSLELNIVLTEDLFHIGITIDHYYYDCFILYISFYFLKNESSTILCPCKQGRQVPDIRYLHVN